MRSVSYQATAGNAQVVSRECRVVSCHVLHHLSLSCSLFLCIISGISLSTSGSLIASVGKDSKICVADVRMRKQLCSTVDDEFRIERVKWTRCCFSPG